MFGVLFWVENDVKVVVFGVVVLSGVVGLMVYLNFGMGVVVGIVIDGCIWCGVWGIVGEVGYFFVDLCGWFCGCG